MSAKKAPGRPSTITNRRATYEYKLEDEYLVGLELFGPEVKALRLNRGQLKGAYVTLKDNELWLVNSFIADVAEPTRTRKLLAKRTEIEAMAQARQSGRTLVPTALLTKGRFIKLKMAVGKGKKRYDKRQAIKQREQERANRQNFRL